MVSGEGNEMGGGGAPRRSLLGETNQSQAGEEGKFVSEAMETEETRKEAEF